MSKRVVTVFGATGTQGGSVINTFLGNSKLSQEYSLRGITRNKGSDKAKALASKGVELAVGDLSDASSLTAAVKGSYAVFGVTNYWETQSVETEVKQGKNIADACVAAGVKHLVWSALPNVTKLTNDTLKAVEHFDGKSHVAEYIETKKGDAGLMATYFMPGLYFSTFKQMTKTNPDVNNGTATLTLPWDPEKTQVAGLAPETDTGTWVGAIIGHPNPSSLDGKWIQAVSEWLTPTQIVTQMSEVLGQEVKFNSVPEQVFIKFLPESMAQELTENMVLVRDYSYYGPGTEKNQAEYDKILEPLGLKTQTFKQYVEATKPWSF